MRGTQLLRGILIGAASVLVGLTFASNAKANLLANPSFENPQITANGEAAGAGTGWNTYNAVFTENTTGRGNLTAEDGDQLIKTFGGGSGVYQDFAVTAGETYNASAFAEFSASDPPTAGTSSLGQLLVIFFNSGNSIIRTDASNIVNSLSSPPADDVWVQGSLSNTVPVGAVDLRFQLNTANQAGGSVFYDNTSLTVSPVPEPASMSLIAISAGTLLFRRRKA
jgi:PEP-CTERM motif